MKISEIKDFRLKRRYRPLVMPKSVRGWSEAKSEARRDYDDGLARLKELGEDVFDRTEWPSMPETVWVRGRPIAWAEFVEFNAPEQSDPALARLFLRQVMRGYRNRWFRLLPLPPVSTVFDLLEAAQADTRPDILSAVAATWQPRVIWRRYSRHVLAENKGRLVTVVTGIMPRSGFFGLGTVITLGLGMSMLGFPTAWPTAFLVGAGVGWWSAAGRMWRAVYAEVGVSYSGIGTPPWQSEQFMRSYFPRLCFKLRQNEVFRGSYETGYIRLESEKPLHQLRSAADLYDLPSGNLTVDEGPLIDAYTEMHEYETNGLQIHKTEHKAWAICWPGIGGLSPGSCSC